MRGIESVDTEFALVTQRANSKLGGEEDEEEECEDLEGETRDHDVVPRCRTFLRVRCDRRHSAAGSLEKERDDIADDEDAGVHGRFDTRILWTEGDDDAGEAEVDTCCHECWCDRETYDLH